MTVKSTRFLELPNEADYQRAFTEVDRLLASDGITEGANTLERILYTDSNVDYYLMVAEHIGLVIQPPEDNSEDNVGTPFALGSTIGLMTATRAHRMIIREPRQIYDALGITENDSEGDFESIRADKTLILRLGKEGIALCSDTASFAMGRWLRQLVHPEDAGAFQTAVGLTLRGAQILHNTALDRARMQNDLTKSDTDWDDALDKLLHEES